MDKTKIISDFTSENEIIEDIILKKVNFIILS
jgi:hypothetical protein